jgi:predicted regulator of Ras-like GTPase activity (Roadblock/LC7/MglB family)
MQIPPDGHYVSSGLVLSPSHEQAIDQILGALRSRMPATLAIVTARDGQFIAAAGEQAGAIDLVALGSLIAGDLAASQQIARMAGVYDDFQVVVREGRDSHIFVCDAGRHMVLFVLAPGNVPVGWIRLLGLEATRSLARVVESTSDDVAPRSLDLDGEDLADHFDRAIARLWQD